MKRKFVAQNQAALNLKPLRSSNLTAYASKASNLSRFFGSNLKPTKRALNLAAAKITPESKFIYTRPAASALKISAFFV